MAEQNSEGRNARPIGGSLDTAKTGNGAGAPRSNILSKEAYVSPEYVHLERQFLWPKVWQVACREEELKRPGDYITYEISDESVIVVRAEDGRIRAFNNACMHRARRLTTGCGHATKLFCRFHGWRWDLNGRIEQIPDREDWSEQLTDDEVSLPEFKTGTWGGFVFITFEADAEPLLDYLAPIPQFLDCFEIDRMRYQSYVTFDVDANWKTAQEAFTEAYHIQTAHRQISPYMDSRATTHIRGKHMQMIDALEPQVGHHAANPETDMRAALLQVYREFSDGIPFSKRSYGVATRLMELPATATLPELGMKLYEMQKEAAIAAGAGWPSAPIMQMAQAGVDWNFFPNVTCVLSPDAAIFYRVRPKGSDPDRCVFDLWRLERYAPGVEPKLERQIYKAWTDYPDMPLVLKQDFQNIADVQAGMKTSAWKGARLNPRLEVSISHFHQVLQQYLGARTAASEPTAAQGSAPIATGQASRASSHG